MDNSTAARNDDAQPTSSAMSATTTPTPSPTQPPMLPANVARNAAPTLGQIGKQTSVNFRLSQLSDSGAESCDADDQTRLIRTPSARSHKFIIIPASPVTGTGAAPSFRQSVSNASLAAMAAQHKMPLALTATTPTTTTTTTTPTAPQSPQQQSEQAETLARQLSSTTTAIPAATTTATTSYKSDTKPSSVNQKNAVAHKETQQPPTALPSDVIHQAHVTPETTTAATGVTFSIEGCEPVADEVDSALHTTTDHSVFHAINSAAAASLLPSTTITKTATVPSMMAAAASTASSLGVDLRPDRNSSTRSVVSAYLPGSQDPASDPNYPFLQPPYTGNKELSASSYIYRDHVANQIYSDVTSVRSLASIGIGSTDGRRLVIRRVPHTATELFSLVHSPSPPPPGGDDDDDSFMDMSDEATNLKPRRQHWGNKMQFVLACIGYSVGLGNVWRFPYMCFKSGGGVFLVPYCIILVICSIPLLFMELSVGQYTGRGPIGALGQLCPLFKGAGLASVIVSFLMSTYYSVIIAYSIYYFFTSFRPNMPWVDCKNRWNTPDCWVPQRVDLNMTSPNTSRTPSEEFFENKVLQISPGIEFPGAMRWDVFACLICAWLMVYFATWKSIKSSAKARYFTATFPFFLIIILLFRAVTLEGSDEGLRYFFRPNWSELKNANVWINAASQNFNSLGITFGSMISFASYNKYNNNIVRDTIAVSVVNVLTSLLIGIFAFATLGNLALEQNTNVRDVIGDGPGLMFVVYPQALAKMPYAQLWAVMFFFMLLCLGLNSQFAIVEVVVTSIQDGFPNWIKRHLGYHEIVVLFVCVISFLFGLPNIVQGGIYFFQLMDHYAASISIMFLAFCQMIAIAWFYGTGRLSKNVKQMTGKEPSKYLKSCWVLLGPLLLFAIWVLSMINYEEPSYHNGRYKYPKWAHGIGWTMASLSLICIPGYAILNIARADGNTFWKRVRNTIRPNIYECRICGEHHCEHDYPEQEQFMLAQEMAGVYKPTVQRIASNKAGYNQLHLQLQQQQQQQKNNMHQELNETPPTTTSS